MLHNLPVMIILFNQITLHLEYIVARAVTI
jgi:hypothetical protein